MSSKFQAVDERRKIIEEMAAIAAKRTPQEQIKRLDDMFGKDQGAEKERNRLGLMVEKGFGNTPKGKLPKRWRQGRPSKAQEQDETDKSASADKSERSKPKRNHPKRNRKGKKDKTTD